MPVLVGNLTLLLGVLAMGWSNGSAALLFWIEGMLVPVLAGIRLLSIDRVGQALQSFFMVFPMLLFGGFAAAFAANVIPANDAAVPVPADNTALAAVAGLAAAAGVSSPLWHRFSKFVKGFRRPREEWIAQAAELVREWRLRYIATFGFMFWALGVAELRPMLGLSQFARQAAVDFVTAKLLMDLWLLEPVGKPPETILDENF